jgi:hypothetical protein
MRPLAIALITFFAPLAIAQGNVPAHAGHLRGHQGHHSVASPLTSLLTPFLGDSFDPADLSSSGDPSAQGPAFLLDAMRSLPGSGGFPGQPDRSQPSSPSSSSEPLLIELQGDRYVRVTSAAIDGEAQPLPRAAGAGRAGKGQLAKPAGHFAKPLGQNAASSAGPMIAAAPATLALPATILIFRDGHSEEVRDYTIADGSLYVRGDFYTDGYWNKKIDLSALNLAATMQTNATRNVKFVIPSSPNEVITRP